MCKGRGARGVKLELAAAKREVPRLGWFRLHFVTSRDLVASTRKRSTPHETTTAIYVSLLFVECFEGAKR
jgi:hypothetical protein